MKNVITVKFSSETMKEFDALHKDMGVKSKADLINYALSLLSLYNDQRKEGFKIQFKKGNEVVEVAMPPVG